MKVYLSHDPGGVLVQARPEGEGAFGDFSQVVGPGQKFLGWTGEELLALGEGEHDLAPKKEVP